MRIALAVWKERISPVFDVSRQILILTIKNESVAGKRKKTIANDDPVHRASMLAELKIQTLICGAVSRPLANMLAAYGIRMIPFIAGEVDEVIAAYLAGNLPNPAMSMPGCCGQHRLFRRTSLQSPRTVKRFGIIERSQDREEENMPGCDGTGPKGKGPGKGAGPCGGQGKQGCGQGGQGAGTGQGRKQGQGAGTGQGRKK